MRPARTPRAYCSSALKTPAGGSSLCVVMISRNEFFFEFESAADLPDDARRVVDRPHHVELVDQDTDRFRAGHHLHVEGLDLHEGPVAPIADGLLAVDDVEPLGQIPVRVGFNHAGRLLKREVGDLLRRADEQELGPWDLVHQQRRHHQSGATRGLRVLLAYEGKHLGDMADAVASENLDLCISMVQSAEDRMRNNVSEPLDWACAGRILPERNVNSYFIVIGAVFRKNFPKVLFAEND